ncbi:hypothetical protein CCHL11_04097 [Colletotrichum chlorophyti]|uniref:CorA-like transporter domain-containing protein n=1 Tax=Colletotrichum chlorophyti TaxID=708187 RepID=A0A1Q8RPG6_9PEZI|nr:hypothetical protein CCHL11_04097 [Colletotrichum chlorophyti]
MTYGVDLATSYRVFDQDPANYLYSTPHGQDTVARLWELEEKLFIGKEWKLKVPVRDVSTTGTVQKLNIFNDGELRKFLGDVCPRNDSNITLSTAYKPDQKCRFIHLCMASTIGPLELDVRMLLRLMTFYQVMPQFLDFLYVYASSHGRDRELRFSGFRTEKVLGDAAPGSIIPELGRSGRRYQLCLNLKTVAKKNDGDWKVRQATIHHQFDVGQGTQLWMIGDPHAVLKERTARLFQAGNIYPTSFSTMQQGFASSLQVHLDFIQWASSDWRWHILFLEEIAEELTKPVRLREKAHIEKLEPASLGDVQKWEEKTNDTIMAMESNVNIMRLLQKFYKELVRDDRFPQRERPQCSQAVKGFSFQLEEFISETQMQIVRAKFLAKVVADRKTILIQHLQTQSAIISSKLAATMYEQADRSAMEAIAVRIVTVVTLIYLPATFSSTFFSTDVVKYQGGEVFSRIALERFLEVTVPLMLLTFVPAGIWFSVEWRRRTRKSIKIKNHFIDLFSNEADRSLLQ